MYPTFISTKFWGELYPEVVRKKSVALRRLSKAISKLLQEAVGNSVDISAALLPRFLIACFIWNHIRFYAKYMKY